MQYTDYKKQVADLIECALDSYEDGQKIFKDNPEEG